MTAIEYFYDGVSLGVFDIKENSSMSERYVLAFENGIEKFDMFILDHSRVGARRIPFYEDINCQYSFTETYNGIESKWAVMRKEEIEVFLTNKLEIMATEKKIEKTNEKALLEANEQLAKEIEKISLENDKLKKQVKSLKDELSDVKKSSSKKEPYKHERTFRR